MAIRAKLAISLTLGLAIVVMLVLPLLLMMLPNPGAVLVPGLAGERAGTYVDTARGLYKLYPFAAIQTSFPDGTAAAGAKPIVYVKYRRLDSLSAYGVYAYPGKRPVMVTKKVRAGRVLAMTPVEGLHPGFYYVIASRDGMYSGLNYFYFKVVPGDSGK